VPQRPPLRAILEMVPRNNRHNTQHQIPIEGVANAETGDTLPYPALNPDQLPCNKSADLTPQQNLNYQDPFPRHIECIISPQS